MQTPLNSLNPNPFVFGYKNRKSVLHVKEGYFYADVKFRRLLDAPRPDETKMDQLVHWLDERKAYRKK